MHASASPRLMAKVQWTFNRALLTVALLSQVVAIMLYGQFRLQIFLSIEALVLVPAVLFLAALLAWTSRPWVYLAVALGSLAMPTLLLVIAPHGRVVLNPLIPNDFASKVLLLLSVALALPAGISGFARGRRGLPHHRFRERMLSPYGLVMMVVIGLGLGAFASSVLAAAQVVPPVGTTFDIPPTAVVDVQAKFFAYDPPILRVVAGQATEIRAVNGDVALHTFSYAVNGTRFDHELPAGHTESIVVLFNEPGTVRFWCRLHSSGDGTSGMTGTLNVVAP